MKLVYWAIRCNDDSDCYSLIAKTRKAVMEKYNEGKDAGMDMRGYELPPVRREVEYADGFDLLEQATGEGGSRTFMGRGD